MGRERSLIWGMSVVWLRLREILKIGRMASMRWHLGVRSTLT